MVNFLFFLAGSVVGLTIAIYQNRTLLKKIKSCNSSINKFHPDIHNLKDNAK